MTIRYSYECDLCGHTYIEQRSEDEAQYFTSCHSCGEGNYVEVSSENLAE